MYFADFHSHEITQPLAAIANYASAAERILGNDQMDAADIETALAQTIAGFDRQKPTLIEGESRKIGSCSIPNQIWRQMQQACHLWLDLPREERVRFILSDYRDLKNSDYLSRRLARLSRYVSREDYNRLCLHMQSEQWDDFVELLLKVHYDPLYGKALKSGNKEVITASDYQTALHLLERRLQPSDCCP